MSITAERKQELIKEFAVKKNDTGSPEVQVALLTTNILALQDHFKAHIQDHHSRRGHRRRYRRPCHQSLWATQVPARFSAL